MSADAHGAVDVGGRPAGWLAEGPAEASRLVLLAHGAGAGMAHPFLAHVASWLAARGHRVVRFQFPYMEEQVRTDQRRPPDRQPTCVATWRALVAAARGLAPRGKMMFLAGKSMGARMATHFLAEAADTRAAVPPIRGGVWLGFPLHPAGRPGTERARHLGSVVVPQLFVSGTRDELARPDLLRGVVAELGARAKLVWVEGGDHSLATRRKEPLRGAEAWLAEVEHFVAAT
jgi:predicted alpha/beta-hydrolase family hydrolase